MERRVKAHADYISGLVAPSVQDLVDGLGLNEFQDLKRHGYGMKSWLSKVVGHLRSMRVARFESVVHLPSGEYQELKDGGLWTDDTMVFGSYSFQFVEQRGPVPKLAVFNLLGFSMETPPAFKAHPTHDVVPPIITPAPTKPSEMTNQQFAAYFQSKRKTG
jgi:hypothetical protein